MDSNMAQQFCLKWNNYQTTLGHIFNKLWMNGTFVDVTLVLGNQNIRCHKVILSACSAYFEQLLTEHASHPHPLIVLHDVPYESMLALVSFMYKGEINVSHDQLTSILQVAVSLKVKGLADSEAISNFTKYRLLSSDITKVTQTVTRPDTSKYNCPYMVPVVSTNRTAAAEVPTTKSVYSSYIKSITNGNLNGKRGMNFNERPIPSATKRRRNTNSPANLQCSTTMPALLQRSTESPASLPPSPPSSLGELQNGELLRTSPVPSVAAPEDVKDEVPIAYNCTEIKQEMEEETDCELQIDESAGQSASEGTESDTHSNQNTPGPDTDSRDSIERTETAHSLVAMAVQGAPYDFLSREASNYITKKSSQSGNKKRSAGGARNGERAYTMKELEQGIELVINGTLTPALAIKKFQVPRRTFFRRLSAVRNERGIKPSKDGNYMSIRRKSAEAKLKSSTQNLPSLAVNDNVLNVHHNGTAIKTPENRLSLEDEKKIAATNMISLLNLTNGTNNYEYYLKFFKQQRSMSERSNSSDDKENPRMAPVVDDNSNIADPNVDMADSTRNPADTNGTVEECS